MNQGIITIIFFFLFSSAGLVSVVLFRKLQNRCNHLCSLRSSFFIYMSILAEVGTVGLGLEMLTIPSSSSSFVFIEYFHHVFLSFFLSNITMFIYVCAWNWLKWFMYIIIVDLLNWSKQLLRICCCFLSLHPVKWYSAMFSLSGPWLLPNAVQLWWPRDLVLRLKVRHSKAEYPAQYLCHGALPQHGQESHHWGSQYYPGDTTPEQHHVRAQL